MKVSLNWVREINRKYQCSADPAPDGIDKLVEKIGAQLGAVEEVIDLGKRYAGIVVAKVVACEKHPNADKLSLCLVDDNGVVEKVERNEQGLVQVVCGAPNVKAGQLVAWIPPGVTVPSTYEKDPFVLEAREIRGTISNGMLASSKELALGDNHEGILVIDEKAKPGQPFAEVYQLDDYIIDIENKMFTHRPDLFGMLGIARELAGIQQHVFKSPDWYRVDAPIPVPKNGKLPLSVENKVLELVPRFLMITLSNVAVKPSPVWLQTYLSRVGVRPINNIVDLTNFFMLKTAQPLHAYDYDKVKARRGNEAKIIVRASQKDEELNLLGGKTIKLKEGSVVIATDKEAIGLGGVMGGAGTEVDANTKSIILEVGTFDMNVTRKTAMEYGLFTDAATRFTKNQSPLQNRPVLAKAVDDICKLSGARIASELIDIKPEAKSYEPTAVKVTTSFINQRLGLQLSEVEITKLLKNVEFDVNNNGDKLAIKAPFWRTDIEIPEDIVEEVGRLYGYDHLPLELPMRDLAPVHKNLDLEIKSKIREVLVRAGSNEVLTYSFVHRKSLELAGQDPAKAFHVRNALSPDLQYYRLSLTPSLLEKVHPNIKLGFDEFAIFEVGKAHSPTEVDSGGLPREFGRVALVLAVNKKRAEANYPGASYYWAKKYVAYLFDEFGLQIEYKPLNEVSFDGHALAQQLIAPFEPKRAAGIFIEGKIAGIIGEYKNSVAQALKLPTFCAGFEVFFSALRNSQGPMYQPLNRFPSLDQDLCLRLPVETSYAKATDFLVSALREIQVQHGYQFELEPIDIFQKPEDKDHKQITWRIILEHPERTLTTQEVNKLLDDVSKKAKEELGAVRV